jgi:hypothetical protein
MTPLEIAKVSATKVSCVRSVTDTATRHYDAEKIIDAIRTGKKLRAPIEEIRRAYWKTLEKTGDRKAAKDAVAAEKKKLPGVLWSGRFSSRKSPANEKLLAHSGLLCADLDELGERRDGVRAKILTSPHLWALFCSPTADGIKAVFRVVADPEKHQASYLAVRTHVEELTGNLIDESCKEVSRLCFLSFDPNVVLNAGAVELPPLVKVARPAPAVVAFASYQPQIATRRNIAVELLGAIHWSAETRGYCTCPAQHLHTAGNGARDCEVHLDGAPTIHCFHNSCRGICDAVNRELRSRIGKVEYAIKQRDDEPEAGASRPVRKSAATQLVKFADDFAFFHDAQSRAFVRLDVSGHGEIWPVKSSQFRNLLAQVFYQRTNKAVNRNALADAITTLQGRALFASPEEPVFLRVASHGENILVDVCDPQWRVVEVTAAGWRVLEQKQSPVAFIRTGAMRPLTFPALPSEGSLAPLWELLNVTPAQQPLVAGALLNYFHPHGPYFVLNFVREQGSAKSCAARILRTLIDPNENPLRSPPREERDLLVHAANNWCVALDNLSTLQHWLSDGLCRLSTGGGHSARQLYSDAEEFSLSVKRPVILNGIEDVAGRPDLAERALQIELETIPDNKRIREKDLWRKFEAARPVIFAAILNGLVCALREESNVSMESMRRMADAEFWATAGETAFGWKRGAFVAVYWQNLNEGAIASIDAHPVGVTIRQLLEREDEWSGEPAELLAALNDLASDEVRRAKNWPQTPRVLSACLRRLAQALRRVAIEADFGKKSGRRHIRLCKRGDPASFSSTSS